MSARGRDQSADSEPHFQKSTFEGDPAEKKAARRLARERLTSDPAEERAEHSVFDEPAILPHRPPALIECDWICRNCGYNLRGLQTGRPCPECGRIERYEPPRDGEASYSLWVKQREKRAHGVAQRLLIVFAPLAVLPFAVVYGFLAVPQWGSINYLMLVPVTGELLKLGAALFVVERRGYILQSAGQVYWLGAMSAVLFAIAQNIVLLTVYHSGAKDELIVYRWLVGVGAHLALTLLASHGLVIVWERMRRDHRHARLSSAIALIAGAIAAHAAVNAVVLVYGARGFGL